MPFSGEVTRKRNYKRNLFGEVTFTGNVGVGKAIKRSIGGVITFTGDITTLAAQRLLEGVIRFSGSVTRIKNGVPIGGRRIFNLGKIGINLLKGLFNINDGGLL